MTQDIYIYIYIYICFGKKVYDLLNGRFTQSIYIAHKS